MAWRRLLALWAMVVVLGLAGCGKKAAPEADKAGQATPPAGPATAPAQQAQAVPAAKPAAPDQPDTAYATQSATADANAPGAAAKPAAKAATKPAGETDPLADFRTSEASASGAASGGSSASSTGGESSAKSSSVSVSVISDLAGYKRAVANQRGKVVVVNFWATWCPSCVEEFPSLVKLRDNFGSKIALVTVSGDEKGDMDSKVKPFLAKHNATRNAYLASLTDEAGFASALGWSGSYPVTIIYNRQGEKVEVIENAQSYETFAEAVKKHL